MPEQIKNILYNLSGALIRLLLFFGIIATVLLIVFGNSKVIKTTLTTSNAYSRLVPAIIEDNKKNPATQNSLPFDDPAITTIFTDSFPNRDIKKNTESVIDSVYDWLNNKSPTLKFRVDFTANKQAYAHAIANYAFKRFEALPICKILPETIDPLTSDCRPNNIDISASRDSYEQQIYKSELFLPKTVFTEEDLPKNKQGQTIAQQLSYIPSLFTWLKRTPYIVAGLLLLLSVDLLLLSSRKRKAIQSLSRILIGSGFSIVVFPFLFSYVLPYFFKSFDYNFDDVGTQKIFSEIIDNLTRTVDILYIIIGAAIAVVGFLIFASERLTRPSTKYHNLEKKSGVAVGIKTSPKSLRGKLTSENVPLVSSEGSRVKRMKTPAKYRTLYKKKDDL